ncbi:MAG TPA: alpha/beta fold hydrolase, partial [Myxococcota bacterium]|nr:alpha/beta fold hydrolase [Myxococcota bacterium]
MVLLHTLGLGPDVFRVGGERSLVAALRARGFACYLPSVRGDRESGGPGGAVGFDGVATLDLPAIVAQVRAHAGADRVLVVGHGLGALAALTWIATVGDDAVAAMVALAAPIAFPTMSPLLRAGLRAVARARPDLGIPVRG